MNQVNLLFAFTAGMISFLSPCVFPLIPAYVAHLTGALVKDNRVQANKGLLLIRSISFILGFSLVFVFMGASASFIGQLFVAHRDIVEKISGLLIIIFGLQMTGIFQLRFLMMEKRWKSKKTQPKGLGGSFLLGLAFGTGWTPCVGLALSSILLIAGATATMYKGMLLLWVYSMGLGIPFLVISLILTYSLGVVKKLNKMLPLLAQISGWIFIFMGLLLFFGQMQKISAWLSQFTF